MSDLSGQIYAASSNPIGNMRNKTHNSSMNSRWRFTRSTANLQEPVARSPSVASQTPSIVPPKKLERVTSKMSLFSLFSRPKVEKARGHTEVFPETEPFPARSTDHSRTLKPDVPTHVHATSCTTSRIWKLGPPSAVSGFPTVFEACHCTSMCIRSRDPDEITEPKAAS
jgi:hypothetical protein